MEPLLLRSLLLLILLTQTAQLSSSQSFNNTDELALLSFKSVVTKGNALSSWNSSGRFCMWPGVTCSNRQHPNRVTNLTLESLDLAGTIPPSLSNLTYLTHLNLAGNGITGSIPQELGRLQQLRYLNLSSNSLQGEIPANLSRCSNLEVLSLIRNLLTGNIPAEMGSLKNLQVLVLSSNNITGTIPPSIANLSSLTRLVLASNNLEGSIPAELGRISGLSVLGLWTNRLSGKIPLALFNFSSLYIFDVAINDLSGDLPSDFGRHLPGLKYLNMYENHLVGQFPLSIVNATGLDIIDLTINGFVGLVPPIFGSLTSLTMLQISANSFQASETHEWSFISSLTNCTNLQILDLSKNLFRGSLPDAVSSLSTQLSIFRIRENTITGRIPLGIGDLSGLSVLDIAQNSFSGPIPESFGKLKSLRVLVVNNNMLSGEIPSSIGSLTQMLEIYLSENHLSGSIPGNFAALEKLEVLDLSHNNLTGTLPEGVVGISSMVNYLNLSHNSFVGPLPEEVGKLINLASLEVSHNKFSGRIPLSLGKCQHLVFLNLQGNNFEGTIPNLDGLRVIEVFDVSQNHLFGPIPKFLENLSFLRYLNLSFNDFAGEVPMDGVFSNLTVSSIQGNQKLCGGNYTLNLGSCSKKKHKLSSTVMAIIVVSIVLCSLFLSFFVLWFFLKREPRRLPFLSPSEKEHFLKISYDELFKATNGFTSTNIIGCGGFGVVYKGFLDHERINVAVKVLNQQVHAASKGFMAECNVLRNIRHRNLLKIITSCSTLDFNGNEFRALVYELIPNGNLERWLHADEHGDLGNLNFSQRLNIAIDVASALDYLHNQIETPIVHCDLKPSNVLLDYDMTAYVGDFGVARILSSNTETSTLGIKGTIGYIAPECGVGSPISTSWDVYSYGILLLEMFTRKRPTDEAFQGGLSLRKYVEASFPDQVMAIIDPQLLPPEEDDNECKRILESLRSIMRIALICTKESHGERMHIQDAVRHFEVIKDFFLDVEMIYTK